MFYYLDEREVLVRMQDNFCNTYRAQSLSLAELCLTQDLSEEAKLVICHLFVLLILGASSALEYIRQILKLL